MKQPYTRVNDSKKEVLFNNFLGGIAWGLGVTIGLSIVLALLGILSNAIGLIPFIGEFVKQIIEYIQQNSTQVR